MSARRVTLGLIVAALIDSTSAYAASYGDAQLKACVTGTCPNAHGNAPTQGTAITATGKTDGGTYTPGETISISNSGGGQYALYAEAGGTKLARSDDAATTVTAPASGTLTLLGVRAAGRARCTYQKITLTAAAGGGGGGTPGGGIGGGSPPPSLGGGGGVGGGYYPPPPPLGGSGQAQTASGATDCGMSGGMGFAIGLIGTSAALVAALYFHNKKKGIEGLTLPPQISDAFAGLAKKGAAAGKGGGKGGKAAGLPKGWVVSTSPDGREYYYNQQSGQTSWERPAA